MTIKSTRPTRSSAGIVIALLLVLGAACADDSTDDQGQTTNPTETTEALPPPDRDGLAAIYDPLVEPYGVKITRAALIDREEGYIESATGTHLALYVEPVDDEAYSTAEYVEGMYELTELTAIHAFGTWSELESYDICQEPWQSEDSSLTPFPVTQIDLTREASEAFDWDSGNLPGLLDHIDGDEDSRWVVSPTLTSSPEFQDVNQQRAVNAVDNQG